MTDRLNLVTGATGFTGAYVIKKLLEEDERVVGTDLEACLEDPTRRETLESIGLNFDDENLELVAADLLKPKSLKELFDRSFTHIFHTASLYDYDASLETLRRVNVDGTRNLLAEVEQLSSLERFLHWSTCGVFGKPYTAAAGEKVNVPFDEESPSPKNTPDSFSSPPDTHIVNDYSKTKWEQEKLVWHHHRQKGLPLTVIRPAPIYGPGSSYGHGGIILAIANGLVPAIPADAENYITTSVHVEDVARFAVYASNHDETLGEDYNVVDNSIISYHEFLNYIALLTGQNMRSIPGLSMTSIKPLFETAATAWSRITEWLNIPRVRVFEPQSATYISSSYWLSNRKTLETGFEYKYPDVKEGLKDTVTWYRKMGWLTDTDKVLVSDTEGPKPL